MSVLRMGNRLGSVVRGDKSGITVKCPKCQENIKISGFKNDEPIRCPKCAYPMIRRADLLLIVAACRKIAHADQVGSAVRILGRLSDFVPEAGTALGDLANKYTLPLSDQERWNKLISAYHGGDESAQEVLNRMCKSNPETYVHASCKNCGAPKYYVRHQKGKNLCSFCQCAN